MTSSVYKLEHWIEGSWWSDSGWNKLLPHLIQYRSVNLFFSSYQETE